jgi:hypothetical protein
MGRRGWFDVVGWALILVASARAQDTPPEGAGADTGLVDLATTHFWLHERYTTDKTPKAGASEIGSYRVGFRLRIISSLDTPQAAPKADEQTWQVLYSERPAVMSPIDGRVTSVVRLYESVKTTPAPRDGANLFKDLLIWYQLRAGEPPLVLTLDPARQLDDRVYTVASRQIFVPNLALALPERAIRVGDKYNLSPAGVGALLGAPAQGTLGGTLQSVRHDDPASRHRTALLDVAGRVRLPMGEAGVHAQIRFGFDPVAPPGASEKGEGAPAMFDAPGRIERLVLAQEVTGPGSPDRRLTRMVRRELVLERKFEGVKELIIPPTTPEPTPENSWLAYRDPKDRFTIRHPQEYQPAPAEDPDTVMFNHDTARGPDLISLSVRTLSSQDVDKLRSGRIAAWKADGIKLAENQVSAAGKLAGADWASRNWEVHHFEAILPMQEGGPSAAARPRLYFYGYIILTGRGQGFYVEATTAQEAPQAFHRQVETMLRTIKIPGESGEFRGAGKP